MSWMRAYAPQFGSYVFSAVLQPDGKVLVGGRFNIINGYAIYHRIARLNTDGSPDSSFQALIDNNDVHSIALRTDGSLIVGGDFTTVGGGNPSYLARLYSNGSLDAGFNPSAPGPVLSLAIQPDGKTLMGGAYSSNIFRLSNDSAAIQGLSLDEDRHDDHLAAQRLESRGLAGQLRTLNRRRKLHQPG